MTPVKKPQQYYAYLRVSSKTQAKRKGINDSNITLSQETQLNIIRRYVESKGGVLVGYETEVETGTNPDRPVYRRCVNQCRINNYVMITAYLDRMHRNVEAMSKLMNSGIDFVFCDFPDASRLTIHIMSALAEYQAEQTKEKINATISRKRSLSANGKIPVHKKSLQAIEQHRDPAKATLAKSDKAYFNECNITAGDTVVDKRTAGWTYQRIADHLNAKGMLTRTGKAWTAKGCQLLYERYSAIPIETQLKQRSAAVVATIIA